MNQPIDGNFDIDVEALNKKYAEERAKRLRPDAIHQYRELKGTEFDRDPHADPDFKRDAIVENTADFGGTWYWNRYPGAACDVEAYVYMPMLEELGYLPSEKYAKAPEI